jgi:flagellar protein FlaG
MQITALDPGLKAAATVPVPAVTPVVAPRPPDVVLVGTAVQGPGDTRAASDPSLEDAASRMERYVASVGRSLQFRVDEDSGQVVVSVRDPSTGELIRQIPSEDALKIAEQLSQDPASRVASVIIDGLA